MKSPTRFLLAAGLLAAVFSSAQAKIERLVEKTFAVQPGGRLRLETEGGEIRVSPSADNVVKVTAREKIRATSEAEADELLKRLDLTIEQNGNDVTATAKYERPAMGLHFGSWPPVTVDFIVSVPASFASDLRTSGGGVTLEGAQGAVNLRTSGGNIAVGVVAGETELSTSGGGIRVDAVEGSLRASTSGGSIRAAFAGPLKGDCSLSTSGGSVKVTVDKTAAFRLDASTSGGSVEAEGLTLTLEKLGRGRTQLAGAVNGGGALLKLRSSGGDVMVKTR
jgi:hypothetical protein